MKRKALPEKPITPFMVVFTDLDGTLLDHDTYKWKEAKPGLDLLKKRRVPLVFVSSKTRAEIKPLRHDMAVSDPFITENGGGIFFQRKAYENPPPNATPVDDNEGLLRLSLGLPYARLVEALQEIRDASGLNLRGFSDMDSEEIGRLTGLDPKASQRAAIREYDEPFIIPQEGPSDKDAIIKLAARQGLTVSSGGRFYHLQGGNDKGKSMELLISWYKQSHRDPVSVALGDSPNDFPMLERADYPVLVRSKRDFSRLKEKIPRLRYTQKQGPSGWNEVIMDLLKNGLLD